MSVVSDFKQWKKNLVKPKLQNKDSEVTEFEVRLNENNNTAVREKVYQTNGNIVQVNKYEEIEIIEQEVSFNTSQETMKTFDPISDLGIEPMQVNQNSNKNIVQEIIVEEVKGEDQMGGQEQEDMASKCFQDGEWTKWIPER